jgi:predicted DNA-binding protein (MmcQ/YjbR family)
MNFETLRDYSLGKPGTTEGTPFGEGVVVFSVMGKMFALTPPEAIPLSINLKCDPELAVELRDRYEAVRPGYHMNKKHWNTIIIDGTISPREIFEMIDNSYALVVGTLKKSERTTLEGM